jgi:hypothetical protein
MKTIHELLVEIPESTFDEKHKGDIFEKIWLNGKLPKLKVVKDIK